LSQNIILFISSWYDKYTVRDCPCGLKDIITDGVDGILVENGNVSQLAEKIIYMIEHPEERTRMGANAVIKSARYKIDRLAKDWQQLFESL